MPGLLTAGCEQVYLDRFYQDIARDTAAIGPDAIRRDVRAFSRPGAMRAGFELSRTLPTVIVRDREDAERDGRLARPVLALAGTHSAFAPFTEATMSEVASDVTFRTIPGRTAGCRGER